MTFNDKILWSLTNRLFAGKHFYVLQHKNQQQQQQKQ